MGRRIYNQKKKRRARRVRILVVACTLVLAASVLLVIGAVHIVDSLLHKDGTSSVTGPYDNSSGFINGPSTEVSGAPESSGVRSEYPQVVAPNYTPPASASAALTVPKIRQNPELPTGCEATAAAMLLQAYGYSFTKQQVADALPKSTFTTVEGRRYAAHPNEAFIGSPYTNAYGVYSKPVAQTMRELIESVGGRHTPLVITGCDENTILYYIANNMPVCIWATMGMAQTKYMPGWYIMRDGQLTDEYYEWLGNEHCLVLTGYTDDKVMVNDPLKNSVSWTYDRDTFFTRWKEQGQHAIVLTPSN